MLTLDVEDIRRQTRNVETLFREEGTAPLLFDKFITKTLSKKDVSDKYPMEIRIPKSIEQMLQGDFEPERIIKIDKPIMLDGHPIWYGDSTYGINLLGAGYKNGDSRYPSEERLDDTNIHGIAAGATGQGKSVTLNSFITSVGSEYGPWEVDITLVDAKITAFKKYAVPGRVMPHISSIAATTDAEYIISVLESLKQKMMKYQSVFSKAGVENIIDFRKKTKLNLARHVIFIDEFQTMFKNAKKKMGIITALLDDFARLGRSSGFHLVMASQEPGDVPGDTLNNIQIKIALGCAPSVSEKVLGNDEAATNLGQKGRLIINTNSADKKKSDNRHYRVPYQPVEAFDRLTKDLSDMGDSIGFRRTLSFYDEEALVYEDKYMEFINNKIVNTQRLYLGEPSFVMDERDGDNYVKMGFDANDIENMLVWSPDVKEVLRYGKMLKYNIEAMGRKTKVINNILSADNRLAESIGLADLNENIHNARDSEGDAIITYMSLVYYRRLALDMDAKVFKDHKIRSEGSDQLFDELLQDNDIADTELNRYRCNAVLQLLREKMYIDGMGLAGKSAEELDKLERGAVRNCLLQAKVNGCAHVKLTVDSLPPVFNWVVGLHKVNGWGRDSKPAKVGALKKVLQDCTEANIRFIILTTAIEEAKEISPAIRYHILGGLAERDPNKLKIENYPQLIPNVLGVFFDRYSEGVPEPVKFKKMIFADEIVGG